MRTRTFLVPLVLLAFSTSLLAQEPASGGATVAVLDFTGSSLTLQEASAVGKGLAGMIITELAGRPGVRVIERQQLQSVLQEQKLALSGRVDDATALEIGKLLGAQYLITGAATLGLAKDARLDIRVLNVETSEILRAQKVTGKQEDFLDMVVKIADQFSRDLKLKVPAREPAVEVPFQAIIFYSQGLDFEDKGQPERAIEMYRKALAAFPGHREAKAALERLTKAKGGAS
ncbi:MAG: hypothetical protein HY703_06565 [Gemmatimonadetes bacterium]|nr:hypothetical protein [Gemmatimonadota bacterium]